MNLKEDLFGDFVLVNLKQLLQRVLLSVLFFLLLASLVFLENGLAQNLCLSLSFLGAVGFCKLEPANLLTDAMNLVLEFDSLRAFFEVIDCLVNNLLSVLIEELDGVILAGDNY